MLYTSAEANKILRKLNDDHAAIRSTESEAKAFLAAVGEDVESVRPEYSYEETQKQLDEIERRIRKIKHAINVFNANYVVEGTGMTIDEILVRMPQLSAKQSKLYSMKTAQAKKREIGRTGSNIIDYRYANYDIAKAAEDYDKVCAELSSIQNALDIVNNTVRFEIED